MRKCNNNDIIDVGRCVSNKAYQRQTSFSEVFIGVFMFFLGVLSLTFLVCYVHLYILNGGSNTMMSKKYNLNTSVYNDTIL